MIKIGDELIPLTDAGNAQVFAHEHGADLKWVPEWGSWLQWDGKRWARTPAEQLVPLAVQTARGFYRRASEEQDDEKRRLLAAHAKSSESRGRLEAMLSIARGFMIARADEFDRDRYSLNVDNGTLKLRQPADEFHEHRRQDMITKLAPVTWDDNAESPAWAAFVARVLPDVEVRAWVQRYLGYCLTGDVGEQVLAFFHGRGANGKSTLIELMLSVLGEYAKSGAPDLLLAKHGETHPTEQADLQGARLVSCQETEAGRQWAEALIKRLTGGDKIKARWMRCDFFEFTPTHKLVVSANHKPKVRGQDHAIWRRIKLVPFDVTIPVAERDPQLLEKLRAEASGILRWMVVGCLEWQKFGLGEPKAIAAATADYRRDQDHLGRFLDDECETAPDAWCATTELYRRYQTWCANTGEVAWGRENFREGLLEREGLAVKNTKVARGIAGVHIKSHVRVTG